MGKGGKESLQMPFVFSPFCPVTGNQLASFIYLLFDAELLKN